MKKKPFYHAVHVPSFFQRGGSFCFPSCSGKEKLEVQKEMALSEHYMILSSVMRDMQAEGGDGMMRRSLWSHIPVTGRISGGRCICTAGSSCYIPMWMIGRFLTWKNSGSRRGNAQDPDRRAVSLCGGEIPTAVG